MRISRHIGLNRVDPRAYNGWEGRLIACCNDCTAMASLFARAGYQSKGYFDEQATRAVMLGCIADAAAQCQADDWFVLTYSGHGSQRDSAWTFNKSVESLCLFDSMLDDSSFVSAIANFKRGVNVVVLMDSCFSGGMDRGAGRRIRVAPLWVTRRVPVEPQRGREIPLANYTLISASDSDETSEDGEQFGAFTGTLLDRIAGGNQTWGEWYSLTAAKMSREHPYQHPQLIRVGGDPIDGQTVFA